MVYRKRKTYKKRKMVPKPKVTVNRTLAVLGKGFPKKMMMTHKYTENATMVSTTGSLASFIFSCNGLYDPNITGTGHQPHYFDQMTALYNHYTVIGSRIKAKFILPNSTAVPLSTTVYIGDDTTVPYNFVIQAAENSLAKHCVATSQQSKPLSCTKSWSAKKMFGGNPMSKAELSGTSSSNPAEQSYYIFLCQPTDGFSTQTVYLDVEIQYIVLWTELKDISGS